MLHWKNIYLYSALFCLLHVTTQGHQSFATILEVQLLTFAGSAMYVVCIIYRHHPPRACPGHLTRLGIPGEGNLPVCINNRFCFYSPLYDFTHEE